MKEQLPLYILAESNLKRKFILENFSITLNVIPYVSSLYRNIGYVLENYATVKEIARNVRFTTKRGRPLTRPVKSLLTIAWGFGLAEPIPLENPLYVRTTMLWYAVKKIISSLIKEQVKQASIVALTSGLILPTPASFILRALASGIRNYSELRSTFPLTVGSYYGRVASKILESLITVEAPKELLCKEKKPPFKRYGLIEALIAALKAIGAVKLERGYKLRNCGYSIEVNISTKVTKRISITATDVLLLQRRLLFKELEELKRYYRLPENLERILASISYDELLHRHKLGKHIENIIKVVEEKKNEIISDLRRMYSFT